MIGYYVHHQGLGHLTRALQITAQLRLRGEQVLGMSQLNRPAGWPGEWVRLPSDEAERPWDESAGGVLHWAPLRHPGLSGRMLVISQRLAELSVMVVDVSVEVALLARLFGVPVVVVAMRGDRADRPHLAGYDAATALLAPWEDGFPEGWWPDRWTAKTHFVGAMSRFDHRPFPVAGDQGSPCTPATWWCAMPATTRWPRWPRPAGRRSWWPSSDPSWSSTTPSPPSEAPGLRWRSTIGPWREAGRA